MKMDDKRKKRREKSRVVAKKKDKGAKLRRKMCHEYPVSIDMDDLLFFCRDAAKSAVTIRKT